MAKKIVSSPEVEVVLERFSIITPGNCSPAYRRMKNDWPMVDVLMEGTDAVRAAGEAFLPKHSAEAQKNYEIRLKAAILTPFFKTTVKHMAGRLFAKPVAVQDADESITSVVSNVDNLGKDLTSFASDVATEAIARGLTFILVDFPSTTPDQVRTVADEKRSGVKPYLVHVPATNVTVALFDRDRGQITEIHIKEIVEEVQDGCITEVCQIRVLTPGGWEVWRKDQSVKGKDEAWALYQSGRTSLDFVPVVCVYGGHQKAPFEAEPPLLEMAHLNIAHYQGRSNQQNALTVAQFPILAASGWRGVKEERGATKNNAESSAIFGPKKLFTMDDPAAKIYYVEHTGAAIESGRKYLADLVVEITMMGLQMMVPKTSQGDAITATESDNRQGESMSELQVFANRFQNDLTTVLKYVAAYTKASRPGNVVLSGDFTDVSADPAHINALLQLRQGGDITLDTIYAELQRRGVLSESFDAKAEKEKLSDEEPSFTGTKLPIPPVGASANQPKKTEEKQPPKNASDEVQGEVQ